MRMVSSGFVALIAAKNDRAIVITCKGPSQCRTELVAQELRFIVDPAGCPFAREVPVAWIIHLKADSNAAVIGYRLARARKIGIDRKSTRLNSSHVAISYAVFCLTKQITTS